MSLLHSRTTLLLRSLAGLLLAGSVAPAATFELTKAGVAEINAAFAAGALTSEKLTSLYLARIAAYDQTGPKLNAVILINPKALDEARSLDAERKAGKVRGPLHGIPVLIKDNFDTFDLATTGGSIGSFPWASGKPQKRRSIRMATRPRRPCRPCAKPSCSHPWRPWSRRSRSIRSQRTRPESARGSNGARISSFANWASTIATSARSTLSSLNPAS